MRSSPEPGITRDSVDQVRAAAERLKRANDELRQLNAALNRSNQDLERLAFVASHDLQEPLRAITVYAELLTQNCGREFDTDSAMFVRNIVEGRVKDGGVLLSVHCDASDEISRAKDLLKQTGAEDISSAGEKAASSHGVTTETASAKV